MLGIDESIQAINFCEYYIGKDKTEVRFLLEKFLSSEGEGSFQMTYNTELKKLNLGEEVSFSIVNLNQAANLNFSLCSGESFEKNLNFLAMVRFLDTNQIVANEWIVYFTQEMTSKFEYLLKISIFLSEFNKKQLLDIRYKTLLSIQNRIEQIEIEKYDNPLRKRVKEGEERKKTANLVYTICIQEPGSAAPIVRPEVEIKQKEVSKPKIVEPQRKNYNGRPAPEFEFKAKMDCLLQ